MKQTKGFTLIEVLVYCGVFSVFMTSVFYIFTYSMKYYQAIDISTTLQQNAMMALTRVSDDISDSRHTDIIYSDVGKGGVMFPSPKNINDNTYSFDTYGKLKWQKWVCYYVAADPEESGVWNLYMKEKVISPVKVSDPGPPPFSTVEQFAADTSVKGRVIARRVSKFLVCKGTPPADSQGKMNVRMTMDFDVNNTAQPNRMFEIQTGILVRN